MTLTLAAKKVVVEEVNAVASKAISAVVVDYRGLTVNEMTALRFKARNSKVYLRVVANTLMRRSFENTEFSCLNEHLVGPSLLAFSLESPADAAKLLKEFAKDNDRLTVKVLAVNGIVYDAKQLDAIAALPTKDEAISQLMSVMKAPVEKLARTLAEPYAKLVRAFAALQEKKEA